MRFLVDASLSPSVAQRLSAAGHDATHVRDELRLDSPDTDILDHADQHDSIVVTADTDFGDLLARRRAGKPSVMILRRRTRRRPDEQVALILSGLPDVANDLREGAVVVIEEARIRVRRLPIGP